MRATPIALNVRKDTHYDCRDGKMKKTLKKIVFSSIISFGLIGMPAHAISSQNALDANDSIESSFITGLYDRVSALLPVRSAEKSVNIATSNKSTFSVGSTDSNKNKLTLQRTVGGSGMFRRVVNAPRAGGRLNPTKKLRPNVKRGQLSLSVKAPLGTGLQSKDYEWVIRSKETKISIRKKGRYAKILLPKGKYSVRLKVGNTIKSKTITVGSAKKDLSFTINTGSLRASVSFAGGKSVKATWEVYRLKSNGHRGKKVYSAKSATGIKRALAPGKYQIVTKVGRVVEKKIVRVSSGKTKRATIRLSGSKVKLLATKSDKKSPLFKKTKWIIKNASTNKTVLTKNRHSATVTLPPGKYVATAISGRVTKKKRFVVKPGRTNRVLLAME